MWRELFSAYQSEQCKRESEETERMVYEAPGEVEADTRWVNMISTTTLVQKHVEVLRKS